MTHKYKKGDIVEFHNITTVISGLHSEESTGYYIKLKDGWAGDGHEDSLEPLDPTHNHFYVEEYQLKLIKSKEDEDVGLYPIF